MNAKSIIKHRWHQTITKPNSVLVSNKNIRVYYKAILKQLYDHSKVTVYAMGKAINKAIDVCLRIADETASTTHTATGTEQVIDDIEGAPSRVRLVSTIAIELQFAG